MEILEFNLTECQMKARMSEWEKVKALNRAGGRTNWAGVRRRRTGGGMRFLLRRGSNWNGAGWAM
jgi:hypothetical protein